MSDIKGMFTGGAAWPELNWVVTDSLPLPSPKEGDSYEFNAPEADDVAFLQYTSGKMFQREMGIDNKRGQEREGGHGRDRRRGWGEGDGSTREMQRGGNGGRAGGR